MAQPGWVKMAAVAAAAMGMGLAWPHFGNRAEAQLGGSGNGRYQVVATGNTAMMVDTNTGQTWIYTGPPLWQVMQYLGGGVLPPGSR